MNYKKRLHKKQKNSTKSFLHCFNYKNKKAFRCDAGVCRDEIRTTKTTTAKNASAPSVALEAAAAPVASGTLHFSRDAAAEKSGKISGGGGGVGTIVGEEVNGKGQYILYMAA